LSGVGALWDCVPRVCGGGSGCAGGGVPLGAVLALSWCGKVSLGGILIILISYRYEKRDGGGVVVRKGLVVRDGVGW